MDEFVLEMDRAKFHATNETWNRYALNDPWSVGYVTNLIRSRIFSVKEEWEDFYRQSGREREQAMSALPRREQEFADDFLLKKNAPEILNGLPVSLKRLNYDYGRTQGDFMRKAEFLHQQLRMTRPSLGLDEYLECVRFRVICETWNGVVVRERNVVNRLKEQFPRIEFREVSGEMDYRYGVDYELFLDGGCIGAVQIKPKSYLSDSAYVRTARKANERKHAAYESRFGKRVGVIFGDRNGDILHSKAMTALSEYYRRKFAGR